MSDEHIDDNEGLLPEEIEYFEHRDELLPEEYLYFCGSFIVDPEDAEMGTSYSRDYVIEGGMFDKGTSTAKKLMKLIPEEDLSFYIGLYRIHCDEPSIEEILSEIKAEPTSRKDAKRFIKTIDMLNNIMPLLKEFSLLKEETYKAVYLEVMQNMNKSSPFDNHLTSSLIKSWGNSGGRYSGNFALKILIINLVKNISADITRGKKNKDLDDFTDSMNRYELIADFLTEQGILDEDNPLTADAIRKIYSRNINNLSQLFDLRCLPYRIKTVLDSLKDGIVPDELK